MTPAEELTAAADKLDGLLADVAPGPWKLGIMWGTVINAGSANVTRDTFPGDAAYIVAMNPDVGRALVALLRSVAAYHGARGTRSWLGTDYGLEQIVRAILGTQEDT